ncbi:MAG TPA: SRPBCC domain-containing protein [Bryobacteraceae bacterium]|nr:SRPBCC domain-containing protein [Bryobacteraceae bacterium]
MTVKFAILLCAACAAFGEVKETKLGGFTIEHEVVLAASPAEVYDVVTGDISPWWDHHLSEHPKKLYIDARPGGGFYEIFNDAGDGMLHATVIRAERGKKLQFTGPLPFAGRVVDFAVTYDLTAEPGGGTRFHLTANLAGQVPDGAEKAADGVWRHFLVEKLKPYLESEEYKKRKASAVKNTSFVAPSGERVLRHEAMVNASLADVWAACSSSEGWMTFMAPVVQMELKTGGRFDSNYRVGSKIGDPGTIHNTVLNYVPMEMFSLRVGLTEQFPERPRQAGTLFAVLTFKEMGAKRTLVTISMLGWGMGEDWDTVYKHFDRGNSYTMAELAQRFERGPMDWKEKK